ncbi:transposase [Streptomyces sp. NPDC001709]
MPRCRESTRSASCPLQWRLFVAKEWASDTSRKILTRVPSKVTRREERHLTLDRLDTLAGWGMTPPAVVADAAYGTNGPPGGQPWLAAESTTCWPSART